jgi:hypothetical protein
MTQRLALVPYDGQPPANAELTFGSTEEFFADLKIASARRAYEQQLAARERAVMMQGIEQSNNASAIRHLVTDAIPRLMAQLDAIVGEREDRARADQAREAEQQRQAEDAARSARILDALKALPADAPVESHHPGADLHSVGPSEPVHAAELAPDDGAPGDPPDEMLEKVPPTSQQPTARQPVPGFM